MRIKEQKRNGQVLVANIMGVNIPNLVKPIDC